jgi:hypothetical protein
MKVHIGVKSDPIENRYTFEWLFDICRDLGVRRVQMGSSYSTFSADDGHFLELREKADARQVEIASVFTSHRELGGFASGDPFLDDASRRGWERLIHVAALVGARSAGSNAGIAMRDQPHLRERGVRSFLENVPGLLAAARAAGLDALTVEPMSSVFEFPSTPDEVRLLASQTEPIHASTPATTVPLLLCADISHGVADAEGKVVHDNWSLFEMEIPWMWEFHIKNTDGIFNSTFGFGPEERAKGIVDLHRLKRLIDDNGKRFPVDEITGYLEIGGPKTGRDYTDHHLRRMLVQSIEALQEVFGKGEEQI